MAPPTYRQVIAKVFDAARIALRVSVTNKVRYTIAVDVPNLVTAGALDANDAAGIRFIIPDVPKSGIIVSAWLYDAAKQEIQADLIFSGIRQFTSGVDDAAFDPTDEDILALSVITFTNADYRAFNDNSIAQVDNLGIGYEAPNGVLYCQLVTRGAPTYVAGEVSVRLALLEDA